VKAFKEKLETAYTVQLSRFSFDKTECEQCLFNSERHSLFPDWSKSRCTRTVCLMKKQEDHILDGIITAVRDENVDVYIGKDSGGIHAEIIAKLGELGIEIKTGNVYRMPENPVMPLEEDFENNPADYEQAQKEFQTKQTKWNTMLEMLENGAARKVLVIDNLTTASGYIMQEKETAKEDREKTGKSDSSNHPDSPPSPTVPNSPENPENNPEHQVVQPVTAEAPDDNSTTAIKPDLLATLEAKDRSNREDTLNKVIEDTRLLIRNTEIPLVSITPFEEALIIFVMLDYLDPRHYEFFGIIEGQTMTDDVKLGLYTALSEEQQNVLKRDFVLKHMIQRAGISKRSALLVELAKLHFSDELDVIENTHNEEYLKKRQVILEQMDKINASNEAMQKVA
jgi:ParB family chromosome partitioning protein